MKQLIKIFVFVSLSLNFLFAHSVVLNVVDNEDGTMEIFGGFSTGQSAAGAKIFIKSKIDNKILFEDRIPESGELTIKVPKEPYSIILDSGPGHKVEKDGNIMPAEGFDTITKHKNYTSLVSIILPILFILASIIVAFRRKKL